MTKVRSSSRNLFTTLMVFCFALALSACVDTGPYVLEMEPAPEGVEEPADVDLAEVDVAEVETEEGEFTEADVEPVDEAEVAVVEGADEDVSVETVDLAESLFRASFLIGREVENLDGQDIGDVDDFVVDLESGRILYVVIDYGEVLEIEQAEIPLPLDAFGWNPELEMTLTVEEELLESAPALDEDWEETLEAGWDADIVTFWQGQGLLEAAGLESVPVSVEEIFNIHAGNAAGLIGVVEDVLLHLGEGKARYIAIFADPGFWSPDQELIVPFTDLVVAAVDDEITYTVDVDVALFEEAPLMDREIFLTVDVIDPEFVDALDAFWGNTAE